MACGTPTVITTRGGLWEELIWGQDCVYCDPVDPDALALAICSPLLNSRIRDRLSKYGAATAQSRYTWNEVASRLLDQCIDRNWLPADDKARVLVAGDSGNDLSMFAQGFRGIIVGNAHADLEALTGVNIYRSSHPFADGVMDGLENWIR